jgi:cytochrome c553
MNHRVSIRAISDHLRALLLIGATMSVAFSRAAHAAVATGGVDAGQLEFFEKNIRPVLADKCYKCHSAQSEKVKGGLLLDTREGIRQGGDSGHAVVPGNVGESLLIKALRYTDKDTAMPPQKSGGKLPDNVIADFEKWVKMGAPDPREGKAVVAKKEIDFTKAREFWAFKAPQAAPVPDVSDKAWPRTDLDRHVLAGIEAKGLKPVADADKRSLIRRTYFDLIGLPPTPEDMDAFFKDKSPDAFVKVVDRLLASPQFGERWGRHWLDVARYAESTGKERNFTFPEAWRYRDYVVGAFNADKPYDEFIREQIAGDLLPAKDAAERNEHLIATGFLAIGTKSLNEKNKTQFEMDLVDEQIDVTSRAVLGLTAACARCHDHKFDPIPTKDYYALAGIFRSSRTFFGTAGGQKNKNGSPLLTLNAVSQPAVPQPATAPAADAALKALLAQNPKRAQRFAAMTPDQQAKAIERIKANGKLGRIDAPAAAQTPAATAGAGQAMGVQDGRPGDCPIYVRGEVDNIGPTVPRGFLTILTPGGMPSINSQHSGRLELADWLAGTGNPLTARVMANRVWLNLFGEGIVPTADNFGATGEKPSNPALLDYLATRFMSDGWSVKKLIRNIVLSRTYQLSGNFDAKNYEADPDNVLVWRASPRRLDAEAIRDAILAASGQLTLTPPVGSVVANVGEGYIGKGIRPATFNVNANYRSVYLPIVRDFVPEMLGIFDFAEPSLVVAARETTNVPSQSLFMMNSAFVLENSRALAKRLLAMSQYDYSQRITMAYMLTLSRPPSEAERARADKFLRSEAQGLIPAKNGKAQEAGEIAWATFCQALFACAEFRYLK